MIERKLFMTVINYSLLNEFSYHDGKIIKFKKENDDILITRAFLHKDFVHSIYPPKSLSSFCDFINLKEKEKRSVVPALAFI